MRLKTLAVLVLVAPLAGACASLEAGAKPQAQPEPQPAGHEPFAVLEPLYGVRFDEAGMTVRVNSGGCTKKDDMVVRVDRGASETTVTVVRTRPDPCRSFARAAADVTWPLAELGLKPGEEVRVQNPMTTW